MSENDECIFCEIVAGRSPAHRVWEDEQILIFMDLFPAHAGHTLIIPKRHAADVFETPAEDLRAVVAQSKPLAFALEQVFDCDGIAVIQLNREAAGQTVFHYHMHLIPRNEGEPFGVHGKKRAAAEVLADHASRLAAVFTPAL
ncbi:MAG: HIT family protein [Deltaproteobacteria bacterium]|nr:HIT family protein [Deltaproteobacteria bacterium]MBW2499588.1 HIT family protein [Deltaproteobacteria bacterium]